MPLFSFEKWHILSPSFFSLSLSLKLIIGGEACCCCCCCCCCLVVKVSFQTQRSFRGFNRILGKFDIPAFGNSLPLSCKKKNISPAYFTANWSCRFVFFGTRWSDALHFGHQKRLKSGIHVSQRSRTCLRAWVRPCIDRIFRNVKILLPHFAKIISDRANEHLERKIDNELGNGFIFSLLLGTGRRGREGGRRRRRRREEEAESGHFDLQLAIGFWNVYRRNRGACGYQKGIFRMWQRSCLIIYWKRLKSGVRVRWWRFNESDVSCDIVLFY